MGFLDLGGFLTDAWGIYEGKQAASKANRTNVRMQREQRGWEQMMSNTAIQRRKADLIAAGGNPALAFTNGEGASTPSVNAPTVEPTVRPGDFNFTAKAIAMQQLQLQKAMNQAQIKQVNSAATLNVASAAKAAAETDYTKGLTSNLPLTAENLAAQAARERQATTNLVETLKGIVSDNKIKEIEASIKERTKEATIQLIKSSVPPKEFKGKVADAVLDWLQPDRDPRFKRQIGLSKMGQKAVDDHWNKTHKGKIKR